MTTMVAGTSGKRGQWRGVLRRQGKREVLWACEHWHPNRDNGYQPAAECAHRALEQLAAAFGRAVPWNVYTFTFTEEV